MPVFEVFASALFSGLVIGLVGTLANVFVQGFQSGGENT